MNSYYPGTQLVLDCVFKTTAAVQADPTSALLWYRDPTGTVTKVAFASLTKVTTGEYTYTITPTSSQAGTWYYRFAGTGTVTAAAEDAFVVTTVNVST